jgi:hypothetical protein
VANATGTSDRTARRIRISIELSSRMSNSIPGHFASDTGRYGVAR